MTLRQATDVRLDELDRDVLQRAEDFIHGAVHCWSKNHPGEWFSVSALLGGGHRHWDGTPLQALHDRHVSSGQSDAAAFEAAAADAGRLLLDVLSRDARDFDSDKSQPGGVRYRWVH